jgi:lipoprotein-anchoring transpeptidase ErfK/SrfK
MRIRATVLALILALALATLSPAETSARGVPQQSVGFPEMGESVGWLTNRALNVRSGPSTAHAIIEELPAGTELSVFDWRIGEIVVGGNGFWAKIGEGRYVYSIGLEKPKPAAPPAPPKTLAGRWIDVNLTQQIITAYEGARPVYWAVMSSGQEAWKTSTGTFEINRRILNHTMDSRTLGIPNMTHYRVENVYFTQFFSYEGEAIHYNYWKWDTPFGVPTSHGCLGLEFYDSHFFWMFAELGTPLVIHY